MSLSSLARFIRFRRAAAAAVVDAQHDMQKKICGMSRGNSRRHRQRFGK